MEKISACIVGLGRAGRFHLNSILKLNQFELLYIVDPVVKREDINKDLPENAVFITSLDEAVSKPHLDAVIVSSPTHSHYDYIIQALENGKHVFTEKPLGKSSEEIIKCFELASNKNLALYIGFQRRYDVNFNELKAQINQFGAPRIIKISSRDNPKPSIEYLKNSGNIFHDMLIHDFDMLIYLLGERIPESVYVLSHAYDKEIAAIPDFDTVMVSIKYADGLMCSIDTSRTSPYGYDQRIEIFTEEGMVIAENQRNNTVEIYTETGKQQAPANYSFPTRYADCYLKELIHFGEGIHHGENFNVTKRECILAHQIADLCHESAQKKAVIDFKFWYDH